MTKRTKFGRKLEAALRETIAHSKGRIALPSRIIKPMPAEPIKAIRKNIAKMI